MAIQFSSSVCGRDFIGRKDLLDATVDNISAGQSTSVIGIPGAGLTSVFEALKSRLISEPDISSIYVFITLQKAADNTTLARALCTGLLDGLRDGLMDWNAGDRLKQLKKNALISGLEQKMQREGADYISILPNALDTCKMLGINVVYVIDRFHHAGNNLTTEFYSSLKTYKCTYVIFSNRTIGQIEYEVAARYSETPSTFHNKLDEKYCGPFTPDEYADYLRYLESELGCGIPRNIRDMFASFAGTFPSLLNRIAFAVRQSKAAMAALDRRWLQKQVNIENEYKNIYDYILNIRLTTDEVSAAIGSDADARKRLAGERVENVIKLVRGGGDTSLSQLRDRLVNVGILRRTPGGNYEFFALEFGSYFLSRHSDTLDFRSKWDRVENECRALCFAVIERLCEEDGYRGNITDYLLDDDGYFIPDDFKDVQDKVSEFRKLLRREFSTSEDGTYIFPTQPSHIWSLFVGPLWTDWFKDVFGKSRDDVQKSFSEIVWMRNDIDHNKLAKIDEAKANGKYAQAVKYCDDILSAIEKSDFKGRMPYFPHPAEDSYIGMMIKDNKGTGYGIFHDEKFIRIDRDEEILKSVSYDSLGSKGMRVSYKLKETANGIRFCINVRAI